jgi:hypothetical protein
MNTGQCIHGAKARGFVPRWAILAMCSAVVLMAGMVPERASQAAVRNPEDMLIVDCLLPGQVRKLGRVSSFMTARRPLRTTQADCEIRGGEYVSYDRANYQTALQVWLGQAELGDAEAQNYVGEIYAKGLGIEPNYAKAAEWFGKAVAQGNKRAMINLGYLYEEGRGVEADLARALNLYRQASGAVDDELLFSSTVTAQAEAAQAEIGALKQTVEQQRAESEALRAKIKELEGQLAQRRAALQQSNAELERARIKLIDQQANMISPEEAAQLRALQTQLQAQEAKLKGERESLERDRASYQGKVDADRERLSQLKAQEQELDKRVRAAGSGATADNASRQELARVRAAASELALQLDDAYAKMEGLKQQLASNQQRMDQGTDQFDAERKRMQAAVASSQQDRELLLLLEQQLAEKQREVASQRNQIASLENQITGSDSGGSALAALGAVPGPLLEILEPALTVTRGKPAGMVRPAITTSDVVGKVISRAGLTSLTVNGKPVEVGAGGLFKMPVAIEATGTEVNVAAVDRAGTKTTLEFMLLPAPSGGRAMAPANTAKLPSGVNLGRYYAVVIGNNQYAAYPALSSASNDAQKVADVLKRKYGFQVQVLLNANRLEMLTALNAMREALKPEDNLLVYFAGHGEIDAAQEGYWLPVDAQKGNAATWVSNRSISDILNTMSARHVMVVADSCYSGSMTRASVPVFNSALSAQQWNAWVKTMTASRSRTALTSGGLAPVPDSGGGANSLFARAFVTALEDNSALIEGQKLFREVTATLAAAATQSTIIQVPEYAPIKFSGHEAGEFFLRPRT